MFSRNPLLESHLDRCIDALIAGDDWRTLAEEAGEHELLALMTIAEWLHHTARRLPHDVQPVRKRVWLRLQAQLDPPLSGPVATPHALSRALALAGAGT
ncbi:MAG: hypothetical protein M0R74_01525 [Dehalococcoidia bacterium]|nr:hypothetical protein [Dehalococcoidia bacterium]